MSEQVKIVPSVDLNGAARLIEMTGDQITYVLLSTPGTGKTSLLKNLAQRAGDQWRKPGDYFPDDKSEYVYIDGGTLRENDLFMYMPNRETKTIEQYLTGLINFNDPRPKVIMIDEGLKIPKLLKPLITRLILERYLGDRRLPDNSRVFMTSNNRSDGVGDVIEAHVGNRVGILNLRPSTARVWNIWASENGISSLTRAWCAMNPSAFACHMFDDVTNNPFVFNPRSTNVSFVSLRSLEKNDAVVKRWRELGLDVATAAMSGIVGQAAAESMAAFLNMDSELIKPEDIFKDPDGVAIPEKAAALFMTMFNLVDSIETQDELSNAMRFIKRTSSAAGRGNELQSIFVSMVMAPKLHKLGKNNPLVNEFTKAHPELLV